MERQELFSSDYICPSCDSELTPENENFIRSDKCKGLFCSPECFENHHAEWMPCCFCASCLPGDQDQAGALEAAFWARK